MGTTLELHETDWVRFQVPDRRVLEGFVQRIQGDSVLIGKAPDTPEHEWWRLSDIVVLKKQTHGAPI